MRNTWSLDKLESASMDREQVEDRLKLMGRAYRQPVASAEALLEMDRLYWTEKLLLRLVRRVYRTRLSQLAAALPGGLGEAPLAQLKESWMEAAVEAALGGHELGEWQAVENGWQAVCRRCRATTWMGENGLRL